MPRTCPSCQSYVKIATLKLGYTYTPCVPGIFNRSEDISHSVEGSSFQFQLDVEDFTGMKTPASLPQPRIQRFATLSMIQATAAKQMWGYVIVKKPRPRRGSIAWSCVWSSTMQRQILRHIRMENEWACINPSSLHWPLNKDPSSWRSSLCAILKNKAFDVFRAGGYSPSNNMSTVNIDGCGY